VSPVAGECERPHGSAAAAAAYSPDGGGEPLGVCFVSLFSSRARTARSDGAKLLLSEQVQFLVVRAGCMRIHSVDRLSPLFLCWPSGTQGLLSIAPEG
jgi:hypothetical protein